MSGKVVENYSLLDIIGSGQYGKVYKALNFKNNQLVAVKVVKIDRFKEVPKVNNTIKIYLLIKYNINKLEEFTMNEI